MTNAKHTPGPWQAEWPDCGEYRYVSSTVTTMCPETAVCRLNQSQEADARLIAAAPELLEALYEAEEYFDNRADADHDETGFVPNKEMKLLVSIRAAITKAEGR